MKTQKSKSVPHSSSISSTPTHSNRVPTHEEISARAREIWNERGRPEGVDDEIWFAAERDLAGHLLQGRTDEDAFAERDAPFDADNEPASETDRALDRMAGQPSGRSATSL